MVKEIKTKTKEQAYASLCRLCARAERSSSDALRLMKRWGVGEKETAEVLARLERERFIDDARYAAAFVRDKVRLSSWGENKIRRTLGAKSIDRGIIDTAIRENMPEDVSRLEAFMRKKMKSIRAVSGFELKAKLVRSAAQQGYDLSASIDAAEKIVCER